MATRKLYGGYGITYLREWARELKVTGRTRMTGGELLAACRAANDARLLARETAALAGGTVKGAHFEMPCGCVIIAITDPIARSFPGGADRPFVRGQFVSLCDNCGAPLADVARRLDRLNGEAKRDGYQFFLHSLTRVVFTTDMNENRITVGARVESLEQDSDGEQGTVESFDASGWPNVEFDAQHGQTFTVNPSRLALVPVGA